MDLWQLNIFCKVVENKSFSKAGKAVHLSQPTISSHIKDLEDHFDCRLIDRLGKEALPTKAGELLYTYAKKLIFLRDETETAMSEFQGKIKGKIIIGGSTIPGGYILPVVIGKFVSQFPEVNISLTVGDTDRMVSDILTGDVELAVVGAKSKDKQIHQDILVEDELKLIIPGDHKWANLESVTMDMLADEPYIIRESGSGTLKSLQLSLSKIDRSIDELNIVAEMGNTVAVTQGIKNNIGISIQSPLAVTEELQRKTLCALSVEGLDLKRQFYLTMHKQKSLSPLANAFSKFLKDELCN